MDSAIPLLIAVLGTLLGSTATYVFQRKSSEQAENLAHQRQLRSERMAIYSKFAEAVTELRRCQYSRWHADQENPGNDSEAALEARRLRAVAQHAVFRVQLIASNPALHESARNAFDAASDMHHASSSEQLRAKGDEAGDTLTRFIALASGDVQ
ncbi:hypothetical protein [Streptomyces sp. NBC_00588]|uniref:hypothetical protein n=1 Tax=Streptomyces sp. NBC_00588 TaxID=2975784 RepID=UPI002E8109A1|nr:hypothetical protein [Streptomyces sp. NBC_00588]WUB35904.1 hypothetical protein OHN38_13645 [Streptomyces sp. NBC_00588]